MKLKEQTRFLPADVTNIDEEARTMDLTFSSETPVDQYFGREILSHDPGAVDLSRLKNGAPLLWNHDKNDVRGVVEDARIGADKRGHATVRFSKNPKGQEAFQDAKDKIVRGVSVGYRIKDMKQTGGTRDRPEYTVTKWHPTEISLAPVPADNSIGIGRGEAGEEIPVNVTLLEQEPAPAAPGTREGKDTMPEAVAAAAAATDAARAQAVSAERERITAITALGSRFERSELANKCITEGISLDAARGMFLEEIGSKPVPIASARGAGDIDMSEKEAAGYSIIRAINACMSTDRDPWKGAGFEREISQEIGKRASKDTAGFFMPSTLPMYSGSKDAARAIMEGQRSTSSTAYGATINATQGGANLVATNLLTGSFIDVLRNKTRVMQMGATMLSGLVGNVQIPRQTSGTATYWLSPEGVDVTEAEVIFDSITMTPRTIGARSQITRQMLLQATPDIEMLVRNDLSAVMALGIDAGALNGTGASGQPTGIFNKAGINSVAMGTNGLALANLDPLVQLETLVANANVDDNNMAYLTNSRVIGAMKLLKDSTGRYMWTDNQTAGDWGQRGTSPLPASVNGYPIFRTNQVSNTFTKGTSGAVCSGAVFGNWSDLIIGEWGVLEILPNPYGAGFNNGSIDIRTLQSVDINVRHPLSFGVISDILAG